jgi:K+-sensing histidine kinase KdpD
MLLLGLMTYTAVYITAWLCTQTLSHELRTPLQGIMGIISAMLYELAEEGEQFSLLTTIMASSRLLETLINNMLNMLVTSNTSHSYN